MSAEQLPSYHTKSFQAPRLNGKASASDKIAVACPGFTVTCPTCADTFVNYPTLFKPIRETEAPKRALPWSQSSMLGRGWRQRNRGSKAHRAFKSSGASPLSARRRQQLGYSPLLLRPHKGEQLTSRRFWGIPCATTAVAHGSKVECRVGEVAGESAGSTTLWLAVGTLYQPSGCTSTNKHQTGFRARCPQLQTRYS